MFVAPVDVILTSHDVLEPDVLVVDDAMTITDRGIEGLPLLVIEVLSPSTAGRDRGVKAERYGELGVRHYWLVDPDARRIECHRRHGCTFERVADVGDDATLTLADFHDLALPLAPLWAPSEAARRD